MIIRQTQGVSGAHTESPPNLNSTGVSPLHDPGGPSEGGLGEFDGVGVLSVNFHEFFYLLYHFVFLFQKTHCGFVNTFGSIFGA